MKSLENPVLVLNKNWIAIRVKDVKTAIKLVFRERSHFVDPGDYSVYNWEEWLLTDIKEGEEYIQCTHDRRVKIPEIVILNNYDKVPSYDLRLSKRNIFIRDQFKCQYTGKVIDTKEADIDHVIPRSKGGKTTWDNLVVASKKVNRKKSNRTPEEAGLKLIKKPHKPRYNSVFIDPRKKYPESWNKFIITKNA